MDYKFGMYNHGRSYLAERNYQRNCRELAWGAVLLVATIAVWSLFIIQVMSDSGVFVPLK